jgi:hypothetical protein
MNKPLVTAVGAFALLVAGAAAAHHSPVMFDRSRRQTLTGTVREFAWTNPHASIQLEVTAPDGMTEVRGVEMNSPNNLVKQGWRSNTVKFGDKVSVVVNPLRSGEPGGAFGRGFFRLSCASAPG